MLKGTGIIRGFHPFLEYRSISTTSRTMAKPFESIPGPSALQMIIRRLPGGKYDGLSWSEMQRKMVKEYGPIIAMPKLLSTDARTMLTEPNDFEIAFRFEGTYPNRRLFLTNVHYRTEIAPEKFNNNPGIIGQGEEWGKMRSVVNPVMMKPTTVNRYIPGSDEISLEFIGRLKSIRDKNSEMPGDFANEINKWSLESVSNVAFDTRLNILGNKRGSDKAITFINNVDEFFKLSYALEMEPSIWKFVSTPKYREIIKVLGTISDIAIYYIEQAEESYKRNPSSNSGHEPSVLEKLLKIDRNYAVLMSIDTILAGIDTTTAMVAGLLYSLAKNPEKQEILRKELMNVPVNEYGSLTPKSFNKVPYFHACLKEALRMCPVSAGNTRQAGQNVEIKGYETPQGTDLSMAITLPLRDGRYFRYPNTFIPERWLGEKEPKACPELKATHPFVFLPFGFGPRACIGKRISVMETQTLITRMLQNFRLEYNYDRPKAKTAIVLSPVDEFKLKLVDL